MKRTLLALSTGFFSILSNAQDISLALQKKPLLDEAGKTAQWQSMNGSILVSFANSNIRYANDVVPDISLQNSYVLTAWKGKKVHTQLALWGKKEVKSITVSFSDLQSKQGNRIAKQNISAGFVGYVMTDEFKNGCGYRKPQDFDSSLVADPINTHVTSVTLQKNTVQPIWITVNVPAAASAGNYTGIITIRAGKTYQLKLTVQVLNKLLPPPSQWKFNLDFWQHPAAVARVHKVKLWGDEHFALMKKYYTLLAKAGQKNITASIVNEPWGHQTYDDFPSLIQWTKKKDGSWEYDYSLFDKYISFVMSCGINKRINCYSMVPWKIAFRYYDEALGKDTVFTGNIGTAAYNEFWKTMLTDFTKHLKAKGWFGITAIAMDERPMPAMQ